ncbi:MAG: Regulator of RpoS [Candidatus Erwinia impunctatus]|nr:Regulator of RpoS [Culicoides impunctatus]
MDKPLAKKQILIVEDEMVFRSHLENFLCALGAKVFLAGDGIQGLVTLAQNDIDLILCDLEMPAMGGLAFLRKLRSNGSDTPVLVISATDKMADIASALRLGVQDVLLKPIEDWPHLREAIYAALYPSMFTSKVDVDEQLFRDWDVLVANPLAATQLLNQLQPPVQQTFSHCRVNYRQLTTGHRVGLVLDIAPLSEHELAFHCLDVSCAGDNGILAALLMRTLFNGLFQEQLSGQVTRIPELNGLVRQINLLFHQADLQGEFPLLAGYYHQHTHELILVSAGLSATLNARGHQSNLSAGIPLGKTGDFHLTRLNQHAAQWECKVRGQGGTLKLMLSDTTAPASEVF